MTQTPKHSLTSHAGAVRGAAQAPGDKSLSHRALILASQVPGKTTIFGLLEGHDVLHTAKALGQLGVHIERTADKWLVHGVGIGNLKESTGVLDMGNSGTGARLLMGLVAPYPFPTFFAGDESLSKRPMKRVMEPLEQMGARFTAHSGGRLPLTLTGTAHPQAISYTLPVASAQVKSAILLAALNTPGTTTVIEPHPTRDHTENMLRFFGFSIDSKKEKKGTVITLAGRQTVAGGDHRLNIPADPSSAAFPLVAAIICPGSDVTLPGVCINPLRTGLIRTLKEMGASIEITNERSECGEPVADLRVRHGRLKGITVPAERAPSMIDEYPILAVAAAFAGGETVMHGLAELKVKESDRLAAIIAGLTACGVKAFAEGDSLHVRGMEQPPGGAMVTTHYDHRIAMSFLVMGMAAESPVTVDDAGAIATSFPNFVDLMNALGAKMGMSKQQTCSVPAPRTSPLIIAVDGPAASGKGTLARRLAEHFGLDYLDTGGLYRAVGMKLVYGGKDPHDRKAALEAARSIDADDLANPRLRQERIGQAASIVSAFPEVREALLEYQRDFAKGKHHIPSPHRGEAGRGALDAHRYPIGNIVKNARDLRKNLTDAEKLLWRLLRMQQLGVKFRKQHPIGKYIADFACLDCKLVIELDGGQHSEEPAIKKDLERTKFLENQGFHVLRFWNNDVLQNPEGVLEVVYRHLYGDTCPPPDLPPTGGGTFRGAVLDGRDIGTVVCPDAEFKFFITATLYARAKRRHKELEGEGIEVVFESVLEDLRERDERDENRTVAPLKPADDAILMDTSKLDASEVFAQACEVISRKPAG